MDELRPRLQAALSGRYAIERELGRGGMATVYLALDLKHHRPVAVKVLRPELAAALGADRFLREVEIAARLQHPHVLSLHDSGEADGLLYYVMPYVEGESLRDRLNREAQLPVDDALRIAREVADALAYAHGLGLVHRDIKPENILLEAGHAIVADFGIARAISAAGTTQLTQTGIALGTPAYMSPEQSDADSHLDGRSDLYSLGCVLYEMLAGEPPFTGSTAQAIFARRLVERPRSLRVVRPTLPAHAEKAVETALAKVPADRFASATEFAKALDRIAQRGTDQGWRPKWPSRGAAAAVALSVMAVFALAAIVRRRPPALPSAGVNVVVLPFTHGSEATAAELRTRAGAHLLFVEALKWIPGVGVIDGSDLIGADERKHATAPANVFHKAKRLGGEYLVSGMVLPGAGGPRVTVDLYSLSGGAQIAKSEAQAEGERLDGAVARLALRVVATLAERRELTFVAPRDVLTATSSSVALGHLLQGQARFWRGDFDDAAAAYRAAVGADSACLLALYRLSVAEIWRHDYAAALAAVQAGLARAGQSAPRWAALLRAQRHYLMGQSDSATAAFQQTVLDRPGEIDGWLGLGEALYHFAAVTDHRPTDAMPAFERVMALDSTFAPVYDHLVDLALLQGDAVGARRYLARISPDDPSRPAREAAVAVWFGPRTARADALRRLRAADRFTISDLVALLMHDSFDLPLADTVASFLLGPDRTPDDRRRGAAYRLVALAGQGRWPEAIAAWESAAGQASFDGWIVQAYLAGHPTATVTRPMFGWARSVLAEGAAPDFSLPVSDERQQAVLALVHRATLEGDSTEVRRLLRGLATGNARPESLDPIRVALQASLRARMALLGRDTSRAIGFLERAVSRSAGPYTLFFPLSTMAPQRMMLAELLAARRNRRQSERWLDSFSHIWSLGDVLYASRVKDVRSRLRS